MSYTKNRERIMALINVEKQFDTIKRAAIDAVKTIFPAKKDKHELLLNKIWVEDSTEVDDFASQAKAKAKGNSWGSAVYVDLTLRDVRTRKVIDREKKVKLFLLPRLTDRASYIVKGNEYQVANQLRLKSGAYVKQMKGGGFKTQINLSKGGIKPDILINAKGIVQLKLFAGTVDLLPLLKGLGVADAEIKSAWGKVAYEQNLGARLSPDAAVKKFAEKVLKKKEANVQTARDQVSSFMREKTAILPEMTKLTLGKAHNTMSPQLLLDASAKLISVSAGSDEHDDVDNLAFKEFFSVDDSLKERIEKNTNSILYKVNRNLDARVKIKQIINIRTFGSMIESFFTEDDRSATPEQINPLHMYAGHEKVTFLGPGALSSTQTANEETQNVHPTHLSFLDPVHTPESDKIGLNLGLTMAAEKVGKDLKATFYDVKLKRNVTLTPFEVYGKVLAYPDQWDAKTKKFKSSKVKTQIKGKQVVSDKSKVDLVMPHAQFAFSLSTNMIPFMANDNGNRTMMAGKHMEQAISLRDREVPLVQSKMPNMGNASFEDVVGESFSIYATIGGVANGQPISGTVTKITKDYIMIRAGKESHKINLYNNFLLNQKTFLNHELKVRVGDKVKGGQILADSNFTKNGTLALGRNLKTAYIPYKGYNFEDGIVITESAAVKLTSEHIHKAESGLTKSTVLNFTRFLAHFPNEVAVSNRPKMDAEGIIKKGSKVAPGDVLIASLKDVGTVKGLEAVKATFDKSLGSRYRAKIERWNSEYDGTVTEVHKSPDKITVYVKTVEPATIGDKLAGRHGNKGIITKIIPNALAPQNKDGDAVDVMLNPHGVISRINIGQMYESAISKVAKKKGKPYKVENFTGENYLDTVNRELKSAGVSDAEELFDPSTGKSLGDVHVGDPYILKLNKQSTVNFSVRGESGPASKSSLQPVRGGKDGAKAVDLLTMYSMLSHGARANLKEMTTYKSENNPELWEAVKYGKPLPAPKTPFVFEKMVNMLKSSGVDVVKKGSKMYLAPLTDKQVLSMSKMEITRPAFSVGSGDKMRLEKGGFLDPTHLGGTDGTNWGHISLKESMPNPVFEHAIKIMLDMVDSEYQSIVTGAKKVTVNGKEYTSGKAFKALLNQVNIDQELAAIKPTLSTLKGLKLDKAMKKYKIMKALKENGLSPYEAYMRKNIAVLPPKFRPISVLDSGDLTVDDSNYLYRNVAAINKHMNSPVVDLLADEDLVDIKTELYSNMKALSGLESVKVGGREKSGALNTLSGSQPKLGFYQYNVLRKNQNLVGRGTIIPEPKLDMDQVALPEDMSWKLYGPFIIKELVRQGQMASQAQKEVDDRTPRARKALDLAMVKRPVMLNRAPSLHKFSMMAFNPQITNGKAIKIPPLVVTGYNADFDGDTMTVHVPISDKAVRESYKMMPSRNLYKPGTGSLMVGPSQESQLGFYLLTKNPAGRASLNKILPKQFAIKGEMNKGASKDMFMKLSKFLPREQFAKVIDTIKIMGEDAAYETGFTLRLKDLSVVPGRDRIVDMIEAEAKKLNAGKLDLQGFTNKVIGKNGIQDKMDALIENNLKNKDNALYEMVNSGARGNKGQLRQIVGSPLLVQDPRGQTIAQPIRKSFTEGLDLSDYWIASYGARKGMMDRAKGTVEPGVFNKSLMAVAVNNVISIEDCGTREGITFSVNSTDILGRYLQGSQGGLTDETILQEDQVKVLKRKGIKQVLVRTPLKCRAPNGTCRHCFGADENGEKVGLGTNIGAKAGQSLAEPLTQLTMNTFHSGGVVGTGKKEGYTRIKELMDMPENIKVGKSILVTDAGVITDIKPSGVGGYNVTISGKRYVTSPHLKLKFGLGDVVKKGDPLTGGSIAPQDLLALKGMPAVQDYLTSELKQAYGSQGINIDNKSFETIVRSITNRTQVVNDVAGFDGLPGDSVPFTVAEDYNRNRKFTAPLEQAQGNFLSKPIAGLEKGLKLGTKEIKMLRGLGIPELDVEREKLRHNPYLKGIRSLPLSQNDWLAQMGATRIKDAVLKGASQGWMSDLKGYHPVPAFAYGASFGDDEGTY